MNKTCRLIFKWYLKPLWKEIVNTIKKFVIDNNISIRTIKQRLKEEKEKEKNN